MVARTIGLCDRFVALTAARELTVKIEFIQIVGQVAQARPLLSDAMT